VRGRIRSIKPEVADDEELWDLGVETGLPVFQCFTVLWCYADREGRFEWRPRALKKHILPYWDGDMNAVLEALASKSFIIRYTVNGKDYGLVRKLKDHQSFNAKEPPSELPPPDEHATFTRAAPVPHPSTTGDQSPPTGHVWNGTEGNGRGTEGERNVASARDASATSPKPPSPPVDGQGVPVMHHTLDGWEEPPELEAEAFTAGVPRKFYRDRLKKLRNTRIGGRHGVRDRTQFVRDLFGQWKTWAEEESAKHQARAGPGDRPQPSNPSRRASAKDEAMDYLLELSQQEQSP
jgi:hypothetical protein